jgi:hypothetical protein
MVRFHVLHTTRETLHNSAILDPHIHLPFAVRSSHPSTWSAQTATPRDGMAGLAGLWLTSLPAVTALMGGRRDIVVITHGSVGAASEVRALAQCATAALHLRHGMREGARVWLTL